MAYTSGNDINILQASDSSVVGAGDGNDKYLLAPNQLLATQTINISDASGSNTLQLLGGLTIASSKVSGNAIQLILSNGATVNVLGADTFTFEMGGNPLSGQAGIIQTFAQFVTTSLGVAGVPTGSQVISGTGNIAVNADGSTNASTAAIILNPGTTTPVNATSAPDIFSFNVAAAKALTANTQIPITGFDVVHDMLQINTATALTNVTLAALNGVDGIGVQPNAITNSTVINFGSDANGDVISITLAGVVDPALVHVNGIVTTANTISGTVNNDILNGTSAAELIDGLAGNDTINGGGGADTIKGGDGQDRIYASASNASIDGGNDADWLDYSNATTALLINLTTGIVTGGSGIDTITNIEWGNSSKFNDTIIGSDGHDFFSCGEGNDSFSGGGGDDYLGGDAGNDSLSGGAGNDSFQGETGNDTLDGGAGIDSAAYYNASAAVIVDLATGVATGGDGVDVLIGIENLYGSNYDDMLFGDGRNNQLSGGLGNNLLDGRAGDDTLLSASGNDTLIGGDGNDTVQFFGGLADYSIGYNAATSILTITNKTTGPNNAELYTATVSGVEQFVFTAPGIPQTTKTLAEMIAAATGGTDASTVIISAAGTSSAANSNVTFNVVSGNYTHTITGFSAGDVLNFPQGDLLPSVINDDFTDGLVELTYASAGSIVTIQLTGLPTGQDAQLNSAGDFNAVFGAGSLI